MSSETRDLKGLLGTVAAGQALSSAQAEEAFDIIMSGDATPSQKVLARQGKRSKKPVLAGLHSDSILVQLYLHKLADFHGIFAIA